MARGERFSSAEKLGLEDTIRRAELLCRAEFSVFVGDAGSDAHAFATQLHNSLVAPARSVMIMVDPTRRVVEVVTGGWVRRTLTDRSAEHARAPQSLHEHTEP